MVPTRGRVECNGKIAALLELASGFDGDLTVRENTYLRGAMLGYTKKFMDETYREIIDFAELSEYEDRAFKHLSSGMKPPSLTDIGRGRFIALVEHAAAKGVQIAFENQRKLANIAWTFEEFEDAPNVGFCWDTGHEACFSPGRQYMPLFGQRLICTHIHDNSGEFNRDEHLLPFDGKLDFERIARQIRESGFTGSLMLEAIAANSHLYDDMTCEAYLERAAASVRKLRDMVDG
jgi:sugar phosphate isomerase/epimerase